MGLAAGLLVGAFGGYFISTPRSLLANKLSGRPAAQTGSVLGMLAAVLPLLNFVLFFVIILVRGIELGS